MLNLVGRFPLLILYKMSSALRRRGKALVKVGWGKKGTNEENFSRGIWGITRQIDKVTFAENLKGTHKDLEEFVFYPFYYFPLFDFWRFVV